MGCYGAAFSDVTIELTRDVTIMLTLVHGDVNNASLEENNRVRSKISQVTWAQVTCEVTYDIGDRKLHKLLGVEDKAK